MMKDGALLVHKDNNFQEIKPFHFFPGSKESIRIYIWFTKEILPGNQSIPPFPGSKEYTRA
jgi:hypothetical protein